MTAERFPIEAGHVMLFARAIGDTNPIYADEEYALASECGGIVAPPTFVQAAAQFDPDYGMRPKPGVPWVGSGKQATGAPPSAPGAGGGVLHAEQHFHYHRPTRVGDVLTATVRDGATWTKTGKRAGVLHFREIVTEFRDPTGELVITARAIGVQTERPVES